jgi:hypothetical protein
MSKLSLATSGAAATLGLLAGAAQAEPVTLSLSQMDELTAGQAAVESAAVVTGTITAPQGAVTASVVVSTSATDPQGYIDLCENAISESVGSPSGTSTLTVSCVCDSTATGSVSPPG